MTTDPPQPRGPSIERAVRIYRRLLVIYPREFRSEYGDDLVQGFRDLLVFSKPRRGLWWSTARDLFSSAAKERGSMLSPDQPPNLGVVFAVLVAVAGLFLLGPGPFLPLIFIPPIVLIGLPIFGLTRFHRAWLIRRSTGAAVAKQIAVGVASFVPAAAILLVYRGEAGYWVFVAVALTLIVGSALGIIWSLITLASPRDPDTPRRWTRPALILIPSVAILALIIGASLNSYWNSLGPPGDHSVENASADTRALWVAAGAGNVDEVSRLTSETCADPWVKFPIGNGKHNAKGLAETRQFEVSGIQDRPLEKIASILGDYMDDWHTRCVNTQD